MADEIRDNDRRGIERRVEMIERQSNVVQTTLMKIETVQYATKEVIDSRHKALERGQEMLLLKIDTLSDRITKMAGEADESPAGRVLLARIENVEALQKRHDAQITEFNGILSEIRGGIRLLKFIGAGGIGGTLIAMLKAFGWLGHP